MSCILMPKVIGRSGFWCAGLMARPTKKLMSVAFSNSFWAISEAPSFLLVQFGGGILAGEEVLAQLQHLGDRHHTLSDQIHALQFGDGRDFGVEVVQRGNTRYLRVR